VPEGDTIYRTAATLHRALAGASVTAFETVFSKLLGVPLVGQQIGSVRSRAKWVLMTFSGGQVLLTHMRMHGSWHVYSQGARWRLAPSRARIVLRTERVVAVGFDVPVAEWIEEKRLETHPVLSRLGPDPLGEAFSPAEVLRRARARGSLAIEALLLDQGVFAGVGNALKSEILFLERIHPRKDAAKLSDRELASVVSRAQSLLSLNTLAVRERAQKTTFQRGGRFSRGSLDPREGLYVYDRAGRPCRLCGEPIVAFHSAPDGRATYFCPACQSL
jgi:endonuclease-8